MAIVKMIWVLITIVNLSAVLWFVLGTTEFFQRGMGLESVFILMFFGIPSILLNILSITLLVKGWIPASPWRLIVLSTLLLAMLALSPTLFKNVDTSGWGKEHLTTDTMQMTSDNAYEYRLEIINLFKKNSYSRLFLKDTSTNEEIRIPIDFPIEEIVVLFIEKNYKLINLEVTSEAGMYILRPTNKLPFPEEVYNIDVKNKVATRIK